MIDSWQTESRRKELIVKIQMIALALLEETKHQRRITLDEIYERAYKDDRSITRDSVRLLIREMGHIPKCEALLDRIIVN